MTDTDQKTGVLQSSKNNFERELNYCWHDICIQKKVKTNAFTAKYKSKIIITLKRHNINMRTLKFYYIIGQKYAVSLLHLYNYIS